MKKWLGYVLAYFFWIITILLAAWIFFLAREVLPNLLVRIFEDTFGMSKLAGFLDRAFALVLGILWLVLMIVSEETYRTGVSNNKLWERIAAFVGWELLVIFLLDFSLFLFQGASSDAWRWLTLFVELAGGLLLVWAARTLKTSRQKKATLDTLSNPG